MWKRNSSLIYKCDDCGKEYSTKHSKQGHEIWMYRRDDNGNIIGMFCLNCYSLKRNGRVRKNRPDHFRSFKFGHRAIYIGVNLKTGYCSKCPKNIHDGSCKRTNLHHMFYITCIPSAGITELCVRCHRREHDKRPPPKPITYNSDGKIIKWPIAIY